MILLFIYPNEETVWGCVVSAYDNVDILMRSIASNYVMEPTIEYINELEEVKKALMIDGNYTSDVFDCYFAVQEIPNGSFKNGQVLFAPFKSRDKLFAGFYEQDLQDLENFWQMLQKVKMMKSEVS